MISFVKKAMKSIVPYSIYAHIRNTIRYITSIRYVGNKYECPFCKGRFSRFLSVGLDAPVLLEKRVIGGGHRSNSICPRCYSRDRERLIYLFLQKNMQDIFFRNISLLHIAPERNLAIYLQSRSNIDYISADLESPLADIQMDITEIEQQDDTYDVT